MVGSVGGEGVVAGRDEGGSSGGGMREGVVGREGWRREWDGEGSVCRIEYKTMMTLMSSLSCLVSLLAYMLPLTC